MPSQILMPTLAPGMESGTIARWTVAEGDTVGIGDVIAEIETDKAVLELEAADEGTIGRIVARAGTEVKVDLPIAILVADGEAVPEPEAVASDGSPASDSDRCDGEAADEPAVGAIGESRSDSDGATVPAPATAEAERPAVSPPARDGSTRLFASPAARRLAAVEDVDLAAVRGSARNGRIVKLDVENALRARRSVPTEASRTSGAAGTDTSSAPPSADGVRAMYEGREFEEIRLDGMRRTVATRLVEAKRTIPHFYLRREVRLDALAAFRAELNATLADRGTKLSVNDFVIKACALALRDVPEANVAWAHDRVLRLKASDVAVAVAIDGGLLTPVLRDADAKTISALSAEMKALAERARSRSLSPPEYRGGTLTVSNLGMFGIDGFDAIVNPPQGSILAVGAATRRPVANDDGEVEVALMMSVTLSVDHRMIDGALGARLLGAIATRLEKPLEMLA